MVLLVEYGFCQLDVLAIEVEILLLNGLVVAVAKRRLTFLLGDEFAFLMMEKTRNQILFELVEEIGFKQFHILHGNGTSEITK